MHAPVDPHLVEVRNLSVRFKLDDAEVEAVRDISFHVDRGEMLALVGESGSGKSVTARAIMKLLPRTATVSPESRVLLAGTRIDQFSERQMLDVRGDRISMIFQEPMSSLNPIYRVGSQIAEGIMLHQRLTKKQALARALDLLKEVRIPEPQARIEQYPAPALGRPAPARDDRDGDRQQSGFPDRRRADHGARRHRAGRDPEAHPPVAGAVSHGRSADHPRSHHRREGQRPRCRHAARQDRRDQPHEAALRAAHARLHEEAVRGRAVRQAKSGAGREQRRARDRQATGRVPSALGRVVLAASRSCWSRSTT